MDDPAADDGDRAGSRARARGSLLGVACGDALGRPVDGHTAAAVRDRHGRVTELSGADGRPAGTTTVVTAAAVRSAHDLLGDLDAGAPVRRSTAEPEAGADDVVGGAAATLLARAVPYGFPDCDDPGARAAATVEGVAAGVEQTTGAERADAAHDPDSDSLAACAVVAVVVGELVAGGSVDDALSAARSVAFDRGAPVGVRETLAVVGDPAAATLDTGGGVGATLETALHEAVAAAAPEEAVVSAASRGGAASALGAVAGGVAGARAGVDGVPPRWLNELDAVDRLADLAAGLADARIEP